jgi:hypothetical protein
MNRPSDRPPCPLGNVAAAALMALEVSADTVEIRPLSLPVATGVWLVREKEHCDSSHITAQLGVVLAHPTDASAR